MSVREIEKLIADFREKHVGVLEELKRDGEKLHEAAEEVSRRGAVPLPVGTGACISKISKYLQFMNDSMVNGVAYMASHQAGKRNNQKKCKQR